MSLNAFFGPKSALRKQASSCKPPLDVQLIVKISIRFNGVLKTTLNAAVYGESSVKGPGRHPWPRARRVYFYRTSSIRYAM